jgi:hypothetical protein
MDTYLTQQNPVVVPIGSDNSGYVLLMNTSISSKYSSKVSVQSDTSDTTDTTFDQNFLLPKKIAQKTLLGGIFFMQSSSVSGSNTIYTYNTLVNTRSPTSPIFLGSLASETIINQQFSKSITIQTSNAPLPRTNQ